ncbi:hypothetical protein [Rhizobium leguminosarum]
MNSKYVYAPKGEFSGHPIASSKEAAQRRFELMGRSLSLPVTPQPGEGLPDLFLRAISRNCVVSPSVAWRMGFGRIKTAFSPYSYIDLDVDDQRLSDFLGTPDGSGDISLLRYQRQDRGRTTFFGATILTTQIAPVRRVSPRFLASSGYQKAIWSLLSLSFDPGNREYLIDKCPRCLARLTFDRAGMYYCHVCKDPNDPNRPLVDLRDYPQPLAELESYENLDFACSLIDPELSSKRDMTRLLHHDLRVLQRGQLFEFIVLVARLLDSATGKPLVYAVSPQSLHEATGAIRQWPRDIIEISRVVENIWHRNKLRRSFNNPISGAVNAYRSFFGADFLHLLRNQLRSALTATEIEPKRPQTRAERFRRKVPRTKKAGGFDLHEKGERLLYASLVARSSDLVRQEARLVGLPYLELVTLYSDNVVRCPDPTLFKFLETDLENAPDIFSWMKYPSTDSNDGLLPLYRTVTALSGGGVAWAGVIKSVMTRNLEVAVSLKDKALFRRLGVANIGHLQQIIKECDYEDWADDVVLTNDEAGFYIGISGTGVSRLVTSGMLPANGLKFSTVREFRRRYIVLAEVRDFLTVHGYHNRSIPHISRILDEAGLNAVHSFPTVHVRAQTEEHLRTLGCRARH